VVYLHEILGYTFIAIPSMPITIVGIAVSLYLGFKSRSAYQRWWEACTEWASIRSGSRNWANFVFDIIHAEDKDLDPAVRRELIDRHLAWVNALAYMLREKSRLKASHATRIFNHRRVFAETEFHQHPDSFRRYLSDQEAQRLSELGNSPTYLMRWQSARIGALFREGFLDSYRLGNFMTLIDALSKSQGTCERIKNTPFPRQIANFGLMFSWVFIILLPLAMVDVFEMETARVNMEALLAHEYMFTMVPFTVLISWIFFTMEKVSDSVEDPFEGGVNDVPISALCRTIEIELKQMTGSDDVPARLEPVDGVLY